jgi:hypothetical protein
MRDKDILYISNAQAVEVVKALQYMRVAIATARETISTVNAGYALKANL